MDETPNLIGRPSLYTPEIADAICERIATCTLGNNAIAKEFGLNPDTIYVWKHRHPDFAEKYARAKESQQELGVDEIIEISDENPTCVIKGDEWVKECVDPAGIQRNRLRVDTRKWKMAHLAPKRFGDRTTTTLEGNADKPLAVSVDSTELIAKIVGAASKPKE